MIDGIVSLILTRSDELLLAFKDGPMARDLASFFGLDEKSCRMAMDEIIESGRMKVVMRGNAKHLVPLVWGRPVCRNCHREFDLPRRSKRLCCTRSCSIAMSWNDAETRKNRMAAISPARSTPEARARTVEINKARWAKPGEREKLSQRNRADWGDPIKNIKMSVAIAKARRTPERREASRALVKARWDDEVGRKKLVDGIKKSKSTPEARAKFSKLLSDRWKDPVMREKYTQGNIRRNELLKAKRAAAKLALSEGDGSNEKS